MATTYEQERWNRHVALRLRTVANRLYQQERQHRLELRETFIKWLSVVMGAGAFAAALEQSIDATVIKRFAAVLVAAQLASLVFRWQARSNDAAKRQGDWTQLEAEIEGVGIYDYTDEQLDAWERRSASIELGEAAQNRALWARSYVKACEVLKQEPVTPVSRWLLHRPVLLLA